MFILRWPVALVLLALVAASLFPAAVVTLLRTDAVDLSAMAGPMAEVQDYAITATWLEAGLWYGAALFFFIAAVRLMRRTQAFWAWLIGFALYGGRWALNQQNQDGGFVASIQSLSAESFQPENLSATDQPAAQITLLAVVLVIGLLIFIIDAADRAYWNRQEA